jgi:hypothetical protein
MRLLQVIAAMAALTGVALAQDAAPSAALATRPGAVRSHATLHCIGIEWDIEGDANHNAVCAVDFRQQGAAEWRAALPLFRVDYAWYYAKDKAAKPANLFAGSILFLRPGTAYEVALRLKDPDGGEAVKTLTVKTRPVPTAPTGGRVFHVKPGEGGGAGSEKDPFLGIAAAEAAAAPGTTFLLHAGRYGVITFSKAGEGDRYVVWKAAGDGEAEIEQAALTAGRVWIEGLTFRRGGRGNGLVAKGEVADAVVVRNAFHGFHYSILMSRQSRDWYVADNEIVGDKPLEPGVKDPDPLSGEGVELAESVGGHVVCYNRISRVADGISYPGHDCDIYGNDIFDVTDDGLEPDRGGPNVRMWGNRLTNYYNAGLSFQPMRCGPWYFIRNQLVGAHRVDTELRAASVFKFRVQDRFLLVNNTFVSAKHADVYMDSVFTSYSRNNLYISSTGKKPLWVAFRYKDAADAKVVLPLLKPDWRTDVDYDGFDWGADCKSWKEPAFRYDLPGDVQKNYFTDIAPFAASTGIEKHGLRVRKEETFAEWTIPAEPGPVPRTLLTLKPGCNAADAGAVVPGINEDFAGKAPDLGAYELDKPLPHYGPRDAQAMKDHALYWARW